MGEHTVCVDVESCCQQKENNFSCVIIILFHGQGSERSPGGYF